MTTSLKSHLEILSKDRQTLSDLLYNVSQNNPFLEYTPSQDIQQYLEASISNKPSPVFRGLHHECLEAILRKS